MFFHRRSQHQDCTLTPTPPWEQSLGLVTSSAEQDEGCSTQEGDENSRQTGYSKTPHCALRSWRQNHKFTEETTLSPLLSHNSLSFSTYSDLSTEKSIVNTPTLHTWFSPSQSVKKGLRLSCNTKEFSSTQLTKTFSCSSLAWDDLPFSESLTEFLCEKDNATQTEPHRNVQNLKETARNNVENESQGKKHNTHITVSQSRLLADITNTSLPNNGGDRHDLSDSVCKNPVGCVKKGKARTNCASECNQHDVVVSSLSFENEEEQLEGDAYNCSADLFSSSLVIDMNTTTLNTNTDTVRIASEGPALLSNPDKQYLRSEKTDVPHSTPDIQKLKSNKCINRDNLIPPVPQDLDFIPPSQSTPNVKLTVVSGSPASSRFFSTLGEFGLQLDSQDLCAYHGNLSELGRKNTAKITSSLCKLSTVSANQLPLCDRETTKENLVWGKTSRRSHRFTPERRFWKPDKHQQYLPAQQCRRVQREAPNLGPNERISHKCDSSVCDVTMCDYEDNEVPPTPAAKTRHGMKLRRRRLTDDSSSSNFDSTCEGQKGDGVNCKRTLLHPTLTSLQRSVAQTLNCGSEVICGGNLDGPNGYLLNDENQACDWSRDLFSDSL